MLEIKVKYLDSRIEELSKIEVGDWIDLRASRVYRNGELVDWSIEQEVSYIAGDELKVALGVAMEIPKGFEAHVVPRSSTYKNYGVIQTNGVGIIDNSYCGDEDEWFLPLYALRDGEIHQGDRVCQFRIVESMPQVKITKVESLGNANRGGHGSTGKE